MCTKLWTLSRLLREFYSGLILVCPTKTATRPRSKAKHLPLASIGLPSYQDLVADPDYPGCQGQANNKDHGERQS